MNIESEAAPAPQVAALVAAASAAERYADPGVVATCPNAGRTPETRRPIKVILWTLQELGGGFHMPAVRADWCIDAYAAVVVATTADMWIMPGLSLTAGWTAVSEQTMLRLVKENRDSGLDEARRILVALQNADPSSAWQLVAVYDDDGKPAYCRGQAVCFFFKSAEGITAEKAVVVASDGGPMASVTLNIPGHFNCPPIVALLAPLAVGERAYFVTTGSDPQPTGPMPPDALVGFSSVDMLAGNLDYTRFRSASGVGYVQPLRQGTRLKVPFWEEIAYGTESLLENFMAIAPADVLRQDSNMHWEAIKPAQHPTDLVKVTGRLADALAIRHTSAAAAPQLANVRIVDLVRAALDPEVLASLTGGERLDEDGCVVSMRTRCRGAGGAVSQPAIQIAEALLFARLMSEHWPVLGNVHLVAPST